MSRVASGYSSECWMVDGCMTTGLNDGRGLVDPWIAWIVSEIIRDDVLIVSVMRVPWPV